MYLFLLPPFFWIAYLFYCSYLATLMTSRPNLFVLSTYQSIYLLFFKFNFSGCSRAYRVHLYITIVYSSILYTTPHMVRELYNIVLQFAHSHSFVLFLSHISLHICCKLSNLLLFLFKEFFKETLKWKKNLCIYPQIYSLYSFLMVGINIWCHFLSAWRTSFNVSCNEYLLVMNSPRFDY